MIYSEALQRAQGKRVYAETQPQRPLIIIVQLEVGYFVVGPYLLIHERDSVTVTRMTK
jgi:hypothetical protein